MVTTFEAARVPIAMNAMVLATRLHGASNTSSRDWNGSSRAMGAGLDMTSEGVHPGNGVSAKAGRFGGAGGNTMFNCGSGGGSGGRGIC